MLRANSFLEIVYMDAVIAKSSSSMRLSVRVSVVESLGLSLSWK